MQKEDDGFNNSEADGDPAAAFARVEDRLASVHGEVALLRAAIEGLTAARENIEIPDYEPTLERTEKILIALTQRIDPIAKSPLLSMTPDAMAGQIAAAASGSGDVTPDTVQWRSRRSHKDPIPWIVELTARNYPRIPEVLLRDHPTPCGRCTVRGTA